MASRFRRVVLAAVSATAFTACGGGGSTDPLPSAGSIPVVPSSTSGTAVDVDYFAFAVAMRMISAVVAVGYPGGTGSANSEVKGDRGTTVPCPGGGSATVVNRGDGSSGDVYQMQGCVFTGVPTLTFNGASALGTALPFGPLSIQGQLLGLVFQARFSGSGLFGSVTQRAQGGYTVNASLQKVNFTLGTETPYQTDIFSLYGTQDGAGDSMLLRVTSGGPVRVGSRAWSVLVKDGFTWSAKEGPIAGTMLLDETTGDNKRHTLTFVGGGAINAEVRIPGGGVINRTSFRWDGQPVTAALLQAAK